MNVSIKKFGNVLGIELPEEEIKKLGLKEGMEIEVEIKKRPDMEMETDTGWGE